MAYEPQSLISALRALAASVLAVGRTRLELFSLEFAEQKSNALKAGIFAAVGLLCLAMGAAVFTAFVAVLFWDTPHRVLVIGLLALAWVLAGAICLFMVQRSLKQAKSPFALTLAELERDYDVLTSPLADPDATATEKRAVVTRNPAGVDPRDDEEERA
ncbi:hypothetical protein FOZ76_06780 [Verticiella sediminum]|uniref:Phage holin family protein n=1 Tax=Verticiella sediminum TaxID=1247510 RepID=A0A556AVR0_9BURK|nr:phage holin family protein [Verticiella sediminum]TSH97021.1 hypothetical protein FOZ76_06780 [Verticiella sediminum]